MSAAEDAAAAWRAHTDAHHCDDPEAEPCPERFRLVRLVQAALRRVLPDPGAMSREEWTARQKHHGTTADQMPITFSSSEPIEPGERLVVDLLAVVPISPKLLRLDDGCAASFVVESVSVDNTREKCGRVVYLCQEGLAGDDLRALPMPKWVQTDQLMRVELRNAGPIALFLRGVAICDLADDSAPA